MKEYKVLTQKDRYFSGKFDPEVLEQALNSYAAQGWGIVAVATTTFQGYMGEGREQLVMFLERNQ